MSESVEMKLHQKAANDNDFRYLADVEILSRTRDRIEFKSPVYVSVAMGFKHFLQNDQLKIYIEIPAVVEGVPPFLVNASIIPQC